MNERRLKQWHVTESLLATATAEICGASAFQTYRDFIEHYELERALHVLEDAGRENVVSREYWWNLKRATEVMELQERNGALREQLRIASKRQYATYASARNSNARLRAAMPKSRTAGYVMRNLSTNWTGLGKPGHAGRGPRT